MIEKKDINWYLDSPYRLLQKKPFTRGGDYSVETKGQIRTNTFSEAKFSNLDLIEITQDLYQQEFDPSRHKIKENKSIPHIAVRVGDSTVEIDDMTVTAPFQKKIHAAHVLHLATSPMEFTLCNYDDSIQDSVEDLFQEYKKRWFSKNMEKVKYEFISKVKKLGDVGILFRYDKTSKKGKVNVYSYDEGYIIIPNYNEFNEKISTSLYYCVNNGKTKVIDTYDDTYMYRCIQGDTETGTDGWEKKEKVRHGFTSCPLLYLRSKVAWEYAESLIEMWELMTNINAIALKRFGTWGLVLKGQMDEDSFKRDASTLIINLSADENGSKQDAKTLEFPEPQRMIEYLDFLSKQIQLASSSTFMTPSDLKVGGDIGGNAVQLAMINDLAVAQQTSLDWSDFTNDMAFLFGEMLGLEDNQTNKFSGLNITAKLSIWTPESKSSIVTNLSTQKEWLSGRTLREKSPDAAPDEQKRYEKEQSEADALTNATNVNKNQQ